MRILMQGRPDLFAVSGGDTVHLTHTMAALADAGVEVDLSLDLRPDLAPYDLVHVFNLMRADEGYLQVDNAVRQGKPVVVTPLCWDMSEFFARAGGDPAAVRRWPGEQRLRRSALNRAAAVLAGGRSEAEYLQSVFGCSGRVHIVPLGIKPALGRADPEAFRARYGIRDFVLCAARICPHKNQLALIEALAGTGIPLVLIGQVQDSFYFRRCRERAVEGVHFLGPVDEGSLAAAYAAARVHALPSWYEMPGMASLEAAAAGCRVVSTDRGTAVDYLGGSAWYCDPGRVGSIRRAVLAAYQAQGDPPAAERLRREFTWERAAALTLAVYRAVAGAVTA